MGRGQWPPAASSSLTGLRAVWIRYHARRNILVSPRGHPYDRGAFGAALDGIAKTRPDLTWTQVDHPALERVLHPEAVRDYAAILFYDLPGIELAAPNGPVLHEPSPVFRAHFESLLESGVPMIFLHHAICGWPTWSRYAEVIGGRYLYLPSLIDGELHPDSGYVHDVRHRLETVTPHPVTAGLESGFELTGELYLYEVVATDIVPLLRCPDYRFDREHFYSSALALHGRRNARDGWHPNPGSDLLAWARHEKASPIVYLQPGHDGATFSDPNFRRLLGNAIDWVTSPEAAARARSPGRSGAVTPKH